MRTTARPAVAASNQRRRLEIVSLRKVFGGRRILPFGRARSEVIAVDDATLEVPPGGTLAVVGESGSGKTTLARCVAGLIVPDDGNVRLENEVLSADVRRRKRAQQQAIQIVFQNPDAALNPQWTVEQIVARPLQLYGGSSDRKTLRHQVIALLEDGETGGTLSVTLSARDFRRRKAAGIIARGLRRRAADGDLRRTDIGARCVGAGGDPERTALVAGAARHLLSVHFARPGSGAPRGGSGSHHGERQDRGNWRPGPGVRSSGASLYARVDRRDPEARGAITPSGRPRRTRSNGPRA